MRVSYEVWMIYPDGTQRHLDSQPPHGADEESALDHARWVHENATGRMRACVVQVRKIVSTVNAIVTFPAKAD